MAHFEPGDEYDLVDEFAEILDLEEWYEWRSGNGASGRSDSSTLPGITGPTNVELLDEKQPAVVMYLLGALQRFEDRDRPHRPFRPRLRLDRRPIHPALPAGRRILRPPAHVPHVRRHETRPPIRRPRHPLR